MHQSKQPRIAEMTLRRLIGPAGEPSVHIDLTIALRNHTEVKTAYRYLIMQVVIVLF